MYGRGLARKVELSVSPSLMIKIIDYQTDGEDDTIWANFFFEKTYSLMIRESSVKVSFPSFEFHIGFPDSSPIIVKSGGGLLKDGKGTCVSKNYGEVEEALRVLIASTSSVLGFY